MAHKKLFVLIPTKRGHKWRKVYTAKGKWYRRYRLCRVFGLNPFKPIK